MPDIRAMWVVTQTRAVLVPPVIVCVCYPVTLSSVVSGEV